MSSNEQRNGIGIWWEGINDKEKVSVHLDINVWNTVKTHDTGYIEFGIKINNYSNFEKLNIYLPYIFDFDDVEDKSDCFGDKSFVSALFNEKVTITSGRGSETTIKRLNGEEFYVYKPEIIVKDRVLSIKPKKMQFIQTVYYRIRINKLKNIFTKIKDNNFFLEGLFRDIGFVEFDINVHRRLPENIADKLSQREFDFEAINFFYMTDTNTNIIYQSIPNDNSRILEKHIWNSYLAKQNGKDIDKQKIIALHWKKTKIDKEKKVLEFNILNKLKNNKEKKIHDFNIFLKLSFTTRTNIALYIAIITLLFLGMLGGLLGNYLTDFVKYTFFTEGEETIDWVQWKTFLYGISIVILPMLFYLLKKLYNNFRRFLKSIENFLNCLKGKIKNEY